MLIAAKAMHSNGKTILGQNTVFFTALDEIYLVFTSKK